jgi:hypothetical protein
MKSFMTMSHILVFAAGAGVGYLVAKKLAK